MSVLVYLLTLVCAGILFVTAIARLNDMGRKTHNDWHWWVRRAGMVAVAISCALLVFAPFFHHQVDWVEFLLIFGVTISWVTTPSQPPWWKYITKGDQSNFGRRKDDP